MSKRRNICVRQSGFSLVEVMTALFILSVAIVVVLGLISYSTRISFASRDVVIATGLANEGIEVVQNIRDNNLAFIASKSSQALPALQNDQLVTAFSSIDPSRWYWDGDNPNIKEFSFCYSSANPSGVNCYVDYLSLDWNGTLSFRESYPDTLTSNYQLYTDDTSGVFSSSTSGASASRFYRQIQFLWTSSDGYVNNTLILTSYVWWGKSDIFGDFPQPTRSDCQINMSNGGHCVFTRVTLDAWK